MKNTKRIFVWHCFERFLHLALLMTLTVCAMGQSNTPGSSGTVPSATGTTTVNTPSAYPTGVFRNYVRTWVALQPVASEPALMSNTDVTQVGHLTSFVDGLGRNLQTVNWQSSPSKKDMVMPVVYDAFGREEYKFLPYSATTSDGSFKTDPFTDQNSFFNSIYPTDQPAYTGEQFFYGHNQFDNSPLNRVAKSFSPGNTWAGSEGSETEHATSAHYLVNNADDEVQLWTITSDVLTYIDNDNATNIPETSTTYDAGTLIKNVTLDEHHHALVEYKDRSGLLVLKKVQVGNSINEDFTGQDDNWLCTYYVYDDLNQLRFVIPPKAVAIISNADWELDGTTVSELCFRYEYDGRLRMYAKKIPGAAWQYMVYDQRDRLVFSQDGNMRNNSQWHGTLYDGLNREVKTFMMGYSSSPADLQSYESGNTGSGTPGSETTNGSTPSSISDFLDIDFREDSIAIYQAVDSITFEPEFLSGDDDEFVTDLQPGNGTTTTNTINYVDNPIPDDVETVDLTITNYDDYTNTTKKYNTENNSKLDKGQNPYAEVLPAAASTMTRGMVTSSQVRVIENPSDLSAGQWLETATFYDDKGRAIQSQSTNYKAGLDVATNLFDFTGKVLCAYSVHNNPAASIANLRIKTNLNYDHAGRLLNVTKSINDGGDPSSLESTQRTIATYVYDALGQLKEKQIGQKSVTGSGLSADPINIESYAYNIRGWLKGINWQGYGGSGVTTSQVDPSVNKWFGMDLSYDWGFNNNQYNGNISGQRWMSADDGAERSYGYGYDNVNRLLSADFNQNFSGSWTKTDPGNSNFTIDFSVTMGDGSTASSAYDENGNILAMQQKGLVINSSQSIDDLVYTYNSNSNKLGNVFDDGNQPANINLGDFNDKNTSGDDYGYDVNGNLITDKNKRIGTGTGIDLSSDGGIIYNHLNLPFQVAMNDDNGDPKGTITYIYDALGNKLEKRVDEFAASSNGNTEINTKTTYLQGFQYQNDVLQFFSHEEGRVRLIVPTDYNNGQSYAYDYFVKDHLGNTRAVLTDVLQQDVYPAATLEDGGGTVENNFFNIVSGNIVSTPSSLSTSYQNNNGIGNPNPGIDPYANSEKMYRLNGATGDKTGLGMAIKVMAGDNVTIFGNSFWHDGGGSINNTDYNIVVSSLLGLIEGAPSIAGNAQVVSGALTGSAVTPDEVSDWLTNNEPPVLSKPKAYINWILFDEQFRPVVSGSGSGFSPVGAAEELTTHMNSVAISKSGYLYVYCSNESNKDVFFDNLQLVHTRGELAESTHYYPFGLTMAGISDESVKRNYEENKFRFQKQELQSKEFSDGGGLEMYEFRYRMDDPQIGRFWSVDPLADKYVANSIYAFSENKVIGHVEFEGLEAVPFTDPKQALYEAGEQIAYAGSYILDKISTKFEAGITVFSNLFSSNTTSLSLERTVSASAEVNFSSKNFLDFVKANNTSVGAPSILNFKFDFDPFKTAIVVKANVGIAKGENSTEIDKNGIITNKTMGAFDMKAESLPFLIFGFTSYSSDGNREYGGGISLESQKSKVDVQGTFTKTPHGTKKITSKAGVEVTVGETQGFKLFGNASISYEY